MPTGSSPASSWTIEQVGELFDRLQMSERTPIKGRVEDTLHDFPVRTIAFLHIDTDCHSSVRICLEELDHRVAPGGIVQFDDYGHGKPRGRRSTSCCGVAAG